MRRISQIFLDSEKIGESYLFMNWQRLKFRNRLSYLSFMVLLLWLKGVGCVVCCTTELIKPVCHNDRFSSEPAAAQPDEPDLSKDVCRESDCCGQAGKKSLNSEAASANDETAPLQFSASLDMKVCSLLASQTLAFTVSPKSMALPVLAAQPGHRVWSSISEVNKFSFTQPIELRNRSGTYLHHCLLLI